MDLLLGAPWAVRVVGTALVGVASAVWVREVAGSLKPGTPRLLASIPVLVLYWALPFLFWQEAELLSKASVAAMFLWLASFKVRRGT